MVDNQGLSNSRFFGEFEGNWRIGEKMCFFEDSRKSFVPKRRKIMQNFAHFIFPCPDSPATNLLTRERWGVLWG